MQKLSIVVILLLILATVVQAANLTVTTATCPEAYKIVNNSVVCVTCSIGFAAINGTCKLQTKDLNTQTPKSGIEKFVDDAGNLTPENPSLGRFGVMAFALVMFILVVLRLPTILKKITGGK